MKTLFLILSLFVFTVASSAQSSGTLRLGSTDASTLMPGDQVYVPVYCDDIGCLILTAQFYIGYDHSVLSWTGEVQNIFGDESDWTFNDNGSEFGALWVTPENPIPQGQELFEAIFIYYGGETTLDWGLNTECYDQESENIILTLINGCICDLPVVTFHVTHDGNDLEGAWVNVGPLTLPTNASGIAVFSLENGDYDYTVTKDGFADAEGTFTVAGEPVQVEVEMYLCYGVTFNVIPEDSTIIIINGDTLVPGETICLPDGDYWVTVLNPGYYPFEGLITVASAPVTIEIVLDPILFGVTFFVNCCGEPLEGITIIFGGQAFITGSNGVFIANLPEGSYSIWIGGYIFTFSVPETSYVNADICSEVTFHVINELGEPLEGATIDVNGEYLLTDAAGEAFTCLQVGSYLYWAYMDGYLSQDGQFEVDTVAQTIELIMELPSYYSLTFHCYTACENQFNGRMLQINGDTLYSGETIYLPEGFWYFFISWLDCWGGTWEGIDLMGPSIIYCSGLEEPHATFHLVSSQGGNLQGATVNVDTFALVTNNSGEAMFCLPGGNHPYTISKEGYDTISGVFNYYDYCNDSIIDILMNPVAINEQKLSGFKLYPNPSSGKFYLEINNSSYDKIELQVMDLTGRIVYEKKQAMPETNEIDLSGQRKGMYFLRIKTGEENYTQKLIIQ